MEDKLTKLLNILETKSLAKIFKKYMEDNNIKKLDGRKRDNSNTYLIFSKDECWDRVFCNYFPRNNTRDVEIILRKEAGLYLIIKTDSKIAFERSFNGEMFNTFYNEELFLKLYEDHKDFFETLFNLI